MTPTSTIDIRTATTADAEAIEDNHHRCFLDTSATHLEAGTIAAPATTNTSS